MMTNDEKTTRFGLMRHAETVWNREKRIQGQLDSRLTAAGRRQAVSWGHLLKTCNWDRCICSDLARARATADIVNRFCNAPVTCEAGLREQNWGRWSGRSIAQLKQEVPDLLTRLDDARMAIPPARRRGPQHRMGKGAARAQSSRREMAGYHHSRHHARGPD